MALTPEDVVTKQFQHVRFKEGFDPDEVDDFLDEIVVEWRKSIAEADELKAKLAAYESGEKPEAAEKPEEAPAVEEAPAAEEPAAEEPAAAPAVAPAAASAGIIELAQRLHDEHIADGQAQRDKLIADAQTQAASILADAEARRREEVAALEQERSGLEGRITELRQFEHDYRSQLRGFIEDKLRDLDTTGEGATPVAASGF